MLRYAFLLLILALLTGAGISWPKRNVPDADYFFLTAGPSVEEAVKINDDPFQNLELEARAAVILNLNGGQEIFKKNENLEWPLASLTKLVTAAVFDEAAPSIFKEGRLIIPITAEAVNQEGDDGFLVGQSYEAGDLLKIMLIKSSNDASYALSMWLQKYIGASDPAWFVNEMNLFASRIGLEKTYFLNPTGLDIDSHLAGAYSTASELARLFSWLVKNKPDIIGATSKPEIAVYSFEGKKHVFESVAGPVMSIPALMAVKTGYTDLAGGNIVLSFGVGPGYQFVAVILGSSYEGRFVDSLKLYQAVLKYIETYDP